MSKENEVQLCNCHVSGPGFAVRLSTDLIGNIIVTTQNGSPPVFSFSQIEAGRFSITPDTQLTKVRGLETVAVAGATIEVDGGTHAIRFEKERVTHILNLQPAAR
ncbi:MAG: hypothetical protein WCW56_01610 [Candidatus Paceibacterota bacterium]